MRGPSRQAGGHWFEPSTAHKKSLQIGNFRLLARNRNRRGATTSRAVAPQSRSTAEIAGEAVLPVPAAPTILITAMSLWRSACDAIGEIAAVDPLLTISGPSQTDATIGSWLQVI